MRLEDDIDIITGARIMPQQEQGVSELENQKAAAACEEGPKGLLSQLEEVEQFADNLQARAAATCS